MLIKKILKDGTSTTEYKNTNKVILVGIALLVADKLAILNITPDHVKDLAAMMRTNGTEIIGAAMIFGSSISYRLERVFLKYQEIKALTALSNNKITGDLNSISESEE